MKSYRSIRDPDKEDHGIIVKDIKEYDRRMKTIQSRIKEAEMLGIGTSEWEKIAARTVYLAKGSTVGTDKEGKQVTIHTIKQSRSKEGNLVFDIGADVWEKKDEETQ